MRRTLALLALWLLPLTARADMMFSVTNGNDSGAGSLRQAISDANSLNVTNQTLRGPDKTYG